MTKADSAYILLAVILIVVLLLTGCTPSDTRNYYRDQTEWFQINPPRPGLVCWAIMVYSDLRTTSVYCERQ